MAPEPAPFWMARLATAVHGLLYLALLAMPVSGFCMSQSSGHAIHLFNQWDLPQWLPVDRHSKKFWHELHTGVIWLALLSLSTLHVLGVVHHVLIKRDRSLIRMW